MPSCPHSLHSPTGNACQAGRQTERDLDCRPRVWYGTTSYGACSQGSKHCQTQAEKILGCDGSCNVVVVRHVPGSQSPFSLIPDPDQNKKYTSFISVVAYGVYILPFTCDSIVFFLTIQNFQKKCSISCGSCGTLDPRSDRVFADFRGLNIISSMKSPCLITHYSMDNQVQY